MDTNGLDLCVYQEIGIIEELLDSRPCPNEKNEDLLTVPLLLLLLPSSRLLLEFLFLPNNLLNL